MKISGKFFNCLISVIIDRLSMSYLYDEITDDSEKETKNDLFILIV